MNKLNNGKIVQTKDQCVLDVLNGRKNKMIRPALMSIWFIFMQHYWKTDQVEGGFADAVWV